MDIKTIYDKTQNKTYYIGHKNTFWETRSEAIDSINSALEKYWADMDYISRERYNKAVKDLTITQFEDVYNDYSRATYYNNY